MRSKTSRTSFLKGGLIIPLVFFSSFCYSQVRLGVKAGVQSTFTIKNDQHTYGKAGFLIGGIATYALSDKISLNGEVVFSQHNMLLSRYNGTSTTTTAWDPFIVSFKTSNHKFYSFNIPVLAEYHLISSESFELKPYLGPYATYNLKVIEHYIKTGQQNDMATVTVSGSEDVTSEFRNWVYGAALGAKAKIALGENSLIFDIRYNYDITPYKKSFSYSGIPETGQDLYMQRISVTTGFLF